MPESAPASFENMGSFRLEISPYILRFDLVNWYSLKRRSWGRKRDRFHCLGWPDGREMVGQSEASEREPEERERCGGEERERGFPENGNPKPQNFLK